MSSTLLARISALRHRLLALSLLPLGLLAVVGAQPAAIANKVTESVGLLGLRQPRPPAAQLPAEPFSALAAIGAVLTITPVVIGYLGQLRGLSIEEIRDEMTYAAIAALPVALLVGVALIIYLVGAA